MTAGPKAALALAGAGRPAVVEMAGGRVVLGTPRGSTTGLLRFGTPDRPSIRPGHARRRGPGHPQETRWAWPTCRLVRSGQAESCRLAATKVAQQVLRPLRTPPREGRAAWRVWKAAGARPAPPAVAAAAPPSATSLPDLIHKHMGGDRSLAHPGRLKVPRGVRHRCAFPNSEASNMTGQTPGWAGLEWAGPGGAGGEDLPLRAKVWGSRHPAGRLASGHGASGRPAQDRGPGAVLHTSRSSPRRPAPTLSRPGWSRRLTGERAATSY